MSGLHSTLRRTTFRAAYDGTYFSAATIDEAMAIAAQLLFGKPTAEFRPEQRDGILAAFQGNDVIIRLATGSGKTYIFWGVLVLHDLLYNGFAETGPFKRKTSVHAHYRRFFIVVVQPLNGLMMDMVSKFNATKAAKFLDLQAVSTVDEDGQDIATAMAAVTGPLECFATSTSICEPMRPCLAGNVALIATSPEKLAEADSALSAALQSGQRNRVRIPVLLAMDEAHLCSEWGESDTKEGKARGEAFRKHYGQVGLNRAGYDQWVISLVALVYIRVLC